ncbi:MarR family winged helix-turn-helix transcriptional regulator [Paraburkholderia caballeronis]|uniref:DNA-binding transcriptional regulator, MarR family n=1 Tax=Paraburkholderia caballeronis TaxID=416943 RepID=A0A1H7H2V3_9BURK|nr:MarR family transcriptional regulator [Paraburkholderia caballeronis]PXW29665.1 MarR family transcriptional regulator [Paraburkholderia caballeronis]PXX04924.1 MarR family transcriptional regulator [Paraburkholderia caballeronis]RAK05985.1 MarR family transcriptional regulator [Paraburkholderia caballeronis]TDV11069.1 MarR family transcriptional regulator [Paraburkholderia caballeronis]TDV14241.1 MarR family transcriptional regulator [Paraburkholderia caballeronis]
MSEGSPVSGAIGVESSLGYFLSTARNVLAARMDRAVAPLGLTSSQIGVILLLWFGRARTPFEMSRALSYDTGSMTRMLDRLEKKGFVDRQRSSADRRVVELALTAQGQDAARQLPALIDAVLREQLHGFSADDVATLVRLLQRFIANDPATDAICTGAGGCPQAQPGNNGSP